MSKLREDLWLKCYSCLTGETRADLQARLEADNIHEGVDPVIINLDGDSDYDEDLFLDCDED